MRTKLIFCLILFSTILCSLLFNCKKDQDKTIPTITITAVTNFTENSATCGGEVTFDGGSMVTARGLCWGTIQNPTISDDKSIDGTGIGNFSRVIMGLNAGTTYNIRAYATNAEGTAYSNQTTFTTLTLGPVLTTNEPTAVTSTSLTCGGNLTTDSGSIISAKGVCWSTSENPTIDDNKTSDGNGTGNFTSNITGLTPGVTYYLKAYATNSLGTTTYGNQVSTTTLLTSNSVAELWEYNPTNDSWTKKSSLSCDKRRRAVAFSIGNKGYFGTGYEDTNDYSDFYEYDMLINTWKKVKDFPGEARGMATGFSIGTIGYVGVGNVATNDFWAFSPSENSWVQKANVGTHTGRSLAPSFCINGKGYICTGLADSYLKDLLEYDPSIDSWSNKTNFPGTGRWGALGFSIGNKGYVGGGADEYSNFPEDFYQYDPATNTWTQKADLPALFYHDATFTIGTKGYFIDSYDSDVYEYDQTSNTWSDKNSFQVKISEAFGFSANGKGYLVVFPLTTKSTTSLSAQERLSRDLNRIRK